MPRMSRCTRRGHWSVLGAAALTVAACSSNSGVATDRAEPVPTVTTTTAPPTLPPPTDPPRTEAPEPPETDPPDTEPAPVSTINWQEFDEGLETAVIEVPRDYSDPAGPKFELVLLRRLADDQDDKIGSLLINPGGPGVGWRRVRARRRGHVR